MAGERMNDEEMKKESLRSIEESEKAWQEFFANKPKPKNDDEDKKQQEEYCHWYNFVRKQSDTGKTPAEMYEELYGEEPKEHGDEKRPSRMMYFGWDEYSEDYNDERDALDEGQEEAVSIATEIFENNWKDIKRDVEGESKRDACRYCFIAGFLSYRDMMDKKSEFIEEQLKTMSKEDIEKLVEGIKDFGEGGNDE